RLDGSSRRRHGRARRAPREHAGEPNRARGEPQREPSELAGGPRPGEEPGTAEPRERDVARGKRRSPQQQQHATHRRSQRHQLQRGLRLLEREVGTRSKQSRFLEPQQRRAVEGRRRGEAAMNLKALALACVLSTVVAAQQTKAEYRTFATPEEAVKALDDAVKAGNLAEVIAIFAPDGKELAESSDPKTAQQNRQIFGVAFKEGWHLVDNGANKKTLVVGNEDWPFPVPLIKEKNRWRFDTAAGKEEVTARRIGRNELAAIATCKTFVVAQERYAKDGHDGKPAGLYAAALRSDPNRHNGLYWPDVKGQKRSPVGDLVADASAAEGREPGSPLHGYYFRILTAQG